MQKLNLPVISGRLPAARRLSMDDYKDFVSLHLRLTLDKKTMRKQKRQAAVNVKFSFK